MGKLSQAQFIFRYHYFILMKIAGCHTKITFAMDALLANRNFGDVKEL